MTPLPQEWFTFAELAALKLPRVPAVVSGVQRLAERQGWRSHQGRSRPREGQGGGVEYHVSLLPGEAQGALALRAAQASAASEAEESAQAEHEARWSRWGQVKNKQQDAAKRRLAAVQAIQQLEAAGTNRSDAVALVASECGASQRSLWNWLGRAELAGRNAALPALVAGHTGRSATAACDARAWEFLCSDYLRPERPAFVACYRRLEEAAAVQGWSPIPPLKTLWRRIGHEFTETVRTLAREGREAALQHYPAQQRDRSIFRALEAVNADGHQFDVFVRFEDGSIGRPVMLAIQDLYSGRILAHRLDRSENRELVRLAFADLVSSWGIPDQATLDNGRAFASKWITGRMATRFRFKVRDEEPAGLLTQLGIQVHWTQPYSGQSKPIERAFRDLCEEVSRGPFCAGAYTGNRPDAKPENYGGRAIPVEEFRVHVAEQIARHNTRPGRRSQVCAGRSFAETFDESYQRSVVRKAREQDLHLLLLAAEGVTARSRTGEVALAGNSYFAKELLAWRGRKLVLRCDPQNLHDAVYVYSADGQFIARAECREAVGFADVAAARQHAAQRKAWFKAQREALRLGQVLQAADIARMLPGTPPEEPPLSRVVRPLFGQAAPKLLPDEAYEAAMENLDRALSARDEARVVIPFDGEADDGD